MIKFSSDVPQYAVERIKQLASEYSHGKVISAKRISDEEAAAADLWFRHDEIGVEVKVQYEDGRVGSLSLAVRRGNEFPYRE